MRLPRFEPLVPALRRVLAAIGLGAGCTVVALAQEPPAAPPAPTPPSTAQGDHVVARVNGKEITLESEVGRWLKDKELVEVVSGQLAEVGLNVKIHISEFSNYLGILFDKEKRAPMIFVSHDNALLDADRTLTAYFTCDGTGPSYCNEEVSAMIAAARTETDIAKSQKCSIICISDGKPF